MQASQVMTVPESSTWAMLLLGAAVLLRRVGMRARDAILLVLVLCVPTSASAQFGGIREWTNRNGGEYTSISNWNPFSVPTADQAAIFPIDNGYTVEFPSSATTGEVLISRGDITFDLRPSTVSRTLVVPNRLIVGGEHDAKLTILDGTVTAGDVSILPGGELVFDHAITLESTLNISGDLDIEGGRFGRFGSDKLNLSPGSDITIRNQGAFSSSSHHVHQNSSVQVSSGSVFAHSRLQIAGAGATGDGTIHVDGAGSLVKTGFSSAEHVWGVDGHDAIVEVTGGARLQVEGDLSLAAQGFGSIAQIIVDGQDSQFQFPDVGATFTIGSDGSGSASINISNGGLFRHVGGAGNSQVLINRSGQVNVSAGGVFEARNVEFDGGQFNLDGGTLRIDSFKNDLINPNGRLEPGRPIGGANIFGNYMQGADATLAIDLAGVLPNQADAVGVTGNAILDGTLEVQVLNDFLPVLGNEFTILQTGAGNVGGRFETLNLPIIDGKTFDVVYEPNTVKLVVVQASANPVDTDFDGDVDGTDFLTLQRTNPTLIAEWRTQYGTTPSLTESRVLAVPEPSTWAMLLFGAAVVLRREGRHLRKSVALLLVASALTTSTQEANGALIYTYTFQTTQVGAANGQAQSEFSYVQKLGDELLTRDELIGGYVQFLLDGQQSSYGNFLTDDGVFNPIPIIFDGNVSWGEIGSRSGVAGTSGPPPASIGNGGGTIGTNPFTGSIFNGHWLLATHNASDFDDDGDMDGVDFLRLQRSGPWAITDWKDDYGASNSVSMMSSGSASIPEPATCGLLLMGAALGQYRRSRDRVDLQSK